MTLKVVVIIPNLDIALVGQVASYIKTHLVPGPDILYNRFLLSLLFPHDYMIPPIPQMVLFQSGCCRVHRQLMRVL